MEENSKPEKEQDEIIETAKSRFEQGLEADSENIRLALEDMRFRAGEQWPEEIKKARDMDRRPCLTINKIPQNVHQITNDQRQNRPAIKVSPADDAADIETAKVLQGIIRNIENTSNADTVYDVAFDSSVTGGRGFLRLTTDYCDHHSFDQEIKLKSIQDPQCVVLDPSYKEPDGSDANWGFHFEDISKEDFKAQYPDAKACGDGFDWKDESKGWFRESHVRIAEYFYKEFKADTLYLLPDNSTALESDIKAMDEESRTALGITDELLSELREAKKTRETKVPIVKWLKICGNEILEESEWPSQWIPIIPVHGEVLIVDGKRVFEGIIRHAKDPQRMYNYWATCETEAIALAPRAPFIGGEGQFEGHEEKWDSANSKNYSYLEYRPVSFNGQLMPPPQRNFGEAGTQAITNARMLASEDLKSTTSIYDASLGNRSNETSGRAIRSRTVQAQTSNYHFADNLSRSVRHAGRVMVDLIPKIYDTKRVLRIIGEDDEQDIVTVNEIFKDKNNKSKKYDLSRGKYDVNVSTGPSFASKRQEAVESMLELSRGYPKMAEVTGDLIVKNMDFPGAQEVSERLKKTIPPEILANAEDVQIPPQVKAQMDEMGAMLDQVTGQLNQSQEQLVELNKELQSKRMEIESKERIEMAKIEKDLVIKDAELKANQSMIAGQNDLSTLAASILEVNERLDLLGMDEPLDQVGIAQNLESEMAQINNPTGGMSPEMTGEIPREVI
jgi:hypothetical protein